MKTTWTPLLSLITIISAANAQMPERKFALQNQAVPPARSAHHLSIQTGDEGSASVVGKLAFDPAFTEKDKKESLTQAFTLQKKAEAKRMAEKTANKSGVSGRDTVKNQNPDHLTYFIPAGGEQEIGQWFAGGLSSSAVITSVYYEVGYVHARPSRLKMAVGYHGVENHEEAVKLAATKAGYNRVAGVTAAFNGMSPDAFFHVNVQDTGSDHSMGYVDYVRFEIHWSDTAVSKEQSHLTEIKLIPNPASDQVKIEGAQDGSTIQILDLAGKVIASPALGLDHSVSVSELPRGIYLIRLIGKDGTQQTLKLQKI